MGRLGEVRNVRSEIHTSINQWSRPVEVFTESLGRELRKTSRLIDSTGIVGECAIFESEQKPVGVRGCKKFQYQDQVRKITKITCESGDGIEDSSQQNLIRILSLGEEIRRAHVMGIQTKLLRST